MLGFVCAPLGGLASVLHVSALPERRAHDAKLLAAGVLALMLTACGGGGGGGDSGTGGGGGGGDTPLPVAAVISGTSDTPTLPGSLASGSTTDDTTPSLSGTLSAALSTGQKVQVFDGDTALQPAATVSGLQWQFTPAVALAQGAHQFSAAVIGADGRTGSRSPEFAVTIAVPGLQGVTPTEVVRATPTVLTFTGTAWPSAGLSVVPMTDEFDTCTTPSIQSATRFEVTCDFQKLGDQPVEIRLNGQTIGQAQVKVTSNVSNVTWRSPTTNGFGQEAVQPGETVTFKVSGTRLLQGGSFLLFISEVSVCVGPTTEVGSPTQSERQFVCTLGDVVSLGSKTIIVQDNALGSGAIQKLWESEIFSVGARLVSASKLTASGITNAQCYRAGSNILEACSSAGAIALSGAGKQDGMRVDENPLSYSSVGSYSKEECVKDNVTGLIWEGKTASGLRAGSNTYTNFGDGRTGDGSAYVAAVNAQGLCGFNDWRLPTVDELHSIVEYGKPVTAINRTWFPNTAWNLYWSLVPGSAVHFAEGDIARSYSSALNVAIRLVRAGQ